MRPVRLKRYEDLRKDGFLPFEATAYSGNKDLWKSPTFQAYRATRRGEFLGAKSEYSKRFKSRKGVKPFSTTSVEYEKFAMKVKLKYDVNKWKVSKQGKKARYEAYDPYKAFHAKEKTLESKVKRHFKETKRMDYVSPHVKRHKDFIKDQGKIEKRYQLGMFD